MSRKSPRVKPPSQRGIRREDARTGSYDSNYVRFIATHEAGHAVEEGAIHHEVQCLTRPLAEAAVNPLAMYTDGDHHDVESARRIAAVALYRAGDDGGNMTIIPVEIQRNAERLAGLVSAAYEAVGLVVSENIERRSPEEPICSSNVRN